MSDTHTHPRKTEADLGVLHFSAMHLMIALILLFIAVPFAGLFNFGLLVESLATTVVLIAAVLVVGGDGRILATAIVLVAPALVAKWFDLYRPSDMSRGISTATTIVFVGFVTIQLLVYVLRSRYVNSQVLCTAVSAYLLLGFLFASAYSLVSLLVPGAFQRVPASDVRLQGFEAIYFSFVTLSTVGYGDIVPVSNVARMLAMLEATSGMFYVTLLIARLVSVYSREVPAHRPHDTPSKHH